MVTINVTPSQGDIGMTLGLNMSWNTSVSHEDPLPYHNGAGSAGTSNNFSRPIRVFHPYGIQDPMVILIQEIANQLSTYALPAYCMLGIVGNFLTCALITRGRLWELSAAHYLIAIQAADIAYLMNLLIDWLGKMGVPIYRHGGMCHFTTFLSHGSTFLSSWYLVCITVDGFIRISFPAKKNKLCTATRANVVILALAAVAIAVFINISITFGVSARGPHTRCAPLPIFMKNLQTLFKIDIFLNTALPDVIITYLLFHAFVVALHRRGSELCCSASSCQSKRNHSPATSSSITGTNTGGRNPENDERKLEVDYMRFFFVYVIISLFLNLSSQVLSLYYTVYGLVHPNIMLTMRDFVWQRVFIHTYYLRCSIHFFLFMSFSRDFRHTARRTFVAMVISIGHFCCCHTRGNSVTIAEAGSSGDVNDDETVTSLMKDTNSTTPV